MDDARHKRLTPLALTVALGIACCMALPVYAVDAQSSTVNATLSGYETALFARSYPTETTEQRLERLETTLFGQVQTGDIQSRLTQTLSVLSQQFSQLPVQDANSAGISTPSPIDGQPIPTQIPTLPQTASGPGDGTDYPTVTEMERNLFQKSYTIEDITQRLKRLEMHVFKQTFDSLPMVDRVDQLSLKVVPNSPLQVEEQLPLGKGIFSVDSPSTSSGGKRKKKGDAPNPNASLSNKTTTVPAPSDAAIYGHLASLEERLFGQTYGGEILVNRLTRLENSVFGTAHAGDPMERLMAIKSAVAQRPDLNRPANAPITMSSGQGIIKRQWAGNPIPQSSINPQPYNGQPAYRPPMSNQPRPWAIQGDGQVVIPNSAAVPYGSNVVSPYTGLGNSIMQSVSAMEQQVFGRTLEQQQNLIQRVAGLETTLLGRSFPQLNIQQRINQLRQTLQAGPQPTNPSAGPRPSIPTQGLPSTDASTDPLLNGGPLEAPEALTQYNTQAYTNPPEQPQPWWSRLLKKRAAKQQAPAGTPGALPTQSLPYVPMDTGPVEEPINDTPASHQARW